MKNDTKKSKLKSFSDISKILIAEGAGKKHTKEGNKVWSAKSVQVIDSIIEDIKKSENRSILAFEVLIQLFLKDSKALNFTGKTKELESIFLGKQDMPSSALEESFDIDLKDKFKKDENFNSGEFIINNKHLPHLLEIIKVACSDTKDGMMTSMTKVESKQYIFSLWNLYAKAFLNLSSKSVTYHSNEDLAKIIISSLDKKAKKPKKDLLEISLWVNDLIEENSYELSHLRKQNEALETDYKSSITKNCELERELIEREKELASSTQSLSKSQSEIKKLEIFIDEESERKRQQLTNRQSLLTKHIQKELNPLIENLIEFNMNPNPDREIIKKQINQIKDRINDLESWSPR